MSTALNHGDDIAGFVHTVGSDVIEFKAGDRVAAMHELHTPGGSFAEYAVAWDHPTLHIPEKTSFEGACYPWFAPFSLPPSLPQKSFFPACLRHPETQEPSLSSLLSTPHLQNLYQILTNPFHFPEAATLSLAFMTFALGIYYKLQLPTPWTQSRFPHLL